jgi:hypothetical protein
VANELSHDGWNGDEHLQIPFKSRSWLAFRKGRSCIPARQVAYTRAVLNHLRGAHRILSSTRSAVDIVLGKISVNLEIFIDGLFS